MSLNLKKIKENINLEDSESEENIGNQITPRPNFKKKIDEKKKVVKEEIAIKKEKVEDKVVN